MNLDDAPEDRSLDLVAGLRTHDVSARRARHLRRQCHALLQTELQPTKPAWLMDTTAVRRVVVPALGGAWCLAYLVEIVRYAVAIYGYLGTQ